MKTINVQFIKSDKSEHGFDIMYNIHIVIFENLQFKTECSATDISIRSLEITQLILFYLGKLQTNRRFETL